MTALKADVHAIVRRRTNWAVLGGASLLAVLYAHVTLVGGAGAPAGTVSDALRAGLLGSLVATVVGIVSCGSEYRTGAVKRRLLTSPRRRATLTTSLAACGVVGAGGSAVTSTIAFATVASRVGVRGVGSGSVLLALFGGGILLGALWGVIGGSLGIAFRSDITAVLTIAVWLFLVETLLVALSPSLGQLLPGEAQGSLVGAPRTIGALPGATVFLIYVLSSIEVARRRFESFEPA
jgi:hypothetical protein